MLYEVITPALRDRKLILSFPGKKTFFYLRKVFWLFIDNHLGGNTVKKDAEKRFKEARNNFV